VHKQLTLCTGLCRLAALKLAQATTFSRYFNPKFLWLWLRHPIPTLEICRHRALGALFDCVRKTTAMLRCQMYVNRCSGGSQLCC